MNAVAISSRAPASAEAGIDEAVRLGRRLRSAPNRGNSRRQIQHEQDSLKRALHAIYQYGAVNHLNVDYKSCAASCHDDDDEDEEEDDDEDEILWEVMRDHQQGAAREVIEDLKADREAFTSD